MQPDIFHQTNPLPKHHPSFLLDDMFMVKKGDRANLYKAYRQGNVSIETMAIITDIVPVWNYWGKNTLNSIFNVDRNIVEKYRPFVDYNKKQFRDFLVDIHGEN